MNLLTRIHLAWQLVLGRACVTYDWGEVKAEGIAVGDGAALVLITHEEADRLGVK